MKPQIALKFHKHVEVLVLVFVLRPVLMAARTDVKVVREVAKKGAQQLVEVAVVKDVVGRVVMDVLHPVKRFVEIIVSPLVLELALVGVKAIAYLVVVVTVVVTALELVRVDAVMVVLDVLFKYLALVFIFDVVH